jgi:hypothetical protein
MPFSLAATKVAAKHYLHRAPNIGAAFGLLLNEEFVGVITFGVPASRHVVIGVSRERPEAVIELNRLWVDDTLPRNTESWFVARALNAIPGRIVISYADTVYSHFGYVYRASNFFYAGWTDMDRLTPRCDYVAIGELPQQDLWGSSSLHSRDTYRKGRQFIRIRREPKAKYWITTGDRRERRTLERLCLWPKLSWKTTPVPRETLSV